jgi:hypothetical protein
MVYKTNKIIVARILFPCIFGSFLLQFVSLHCRFDSGTSCSGSHNLVDPTGLDIALSRCLEGHCVQIADTEVEVVLRQLTVRTHSVIVNRCAKLWRLIASFFFIEDLS